MLNPRRFPQTATTRFADWPDTLRAAVDPRYLAPGRVNLCPCRVNPGGTVTLRTHCLINAGTITIPAHLARVETAPSQAQNTQDIPSPPAGNTASSIDRYLEQLPS